MSMSDSSQSKRLVVKGLCLKCFYLMLTEDRENFYCDKFKIKIEGLVKSCPGFMPISEGFDQLIAQMKVSGELPEWVEDEKHFS